MAEAAGQPAIVSGVKFDYDESNTTDAERMPI